MNNTISIMFRRSTFSTNYVELHKLDSFLQKIKANETGLIGFFKYHNLPKPQFHNKSSMLLLLNE